jgi:hypothetical protein
MIMRVKTPIELAVETVSRVADETAKKVSAWVGKCMAAQERALEACHRLEKEWSVGHPYCALRKNVTVQDGRRYVFWQWPRADYE